MTAWLSVHGMRLVFGGALGAIWGGLITAASLRARRLRAADRRRWDTSYGAYLPPAKRGQPPAKRGQR